MKIDRSFIPQLDAAGALQRDRRGHSGDAPALGPRVVAEGIETEAQARWLVRGGCTLGQGFLFGLGLEFEDFAAPLVCPT